MGQCSKNVNEENTEKSLQDQILCSEFSLMGSLSFSVLTSFKLRGFYVDYKAADSEELQRSLFGITGN